MNYITVKKIKAEQEKIIAWKFHYNLCILYIN